MLANAENADFGNFCVAFRGLVFFTTSTFRRGVIQVDSVNCILVIKGMSLNWPVRY